MSRILPYKVFAEIADSPAPEWLIEDMLSAGTVNMLCAESGKGKTFLALHLSFCIALGRPVHRFEVEQGPVLYVAAEGSLSIRVKAFRAYHHLEGTDVPLAGIEQEVNLFHKDADLEPLINAAAECAKRFGKPLKLIVLDTLARVMAGGDENSAKDMGILVANVERLQKATGAAVLVVHHKGKDPDRGARGHSSLRAAIQSQLDINSLGSSGAILRADKQKDGREADLFGFRLVPVEVGVDKRGKPIRSCIVETCDAPGHQSKRTGAKPGSDAARLLETLQRLARDGGQVPIEELRQEFIATACEGREADTARKAFNRARDLLLGKELIAIEDDHVCVTDK